LFEQALKIDPNEAGPWRVAPTYATKFRNWKKPEIDCDARVLDLADLAIALASDGAAPYVGKG
jgi:hypothetical protein